MSRLESPWSLWASFETLLWKEHSGWSHVLATLWEAEGRDDRACTAPCQLPHLTVPLGDFTTQKFGFEESK